MLNKRTLIPTQWDGETRRQTFCQYGLMEYPNDFPNLCIIFYESCHRVWCLPKYYRVYCYFYGDSFGLKWKEFWNILVIKSPKFLYLSVLGELLLSSIKIRVTCLPKTSFWFFEWSDSLYWSCQFVCLCVVRLKLDVLIKVYSLKSIVNDLQSETVSSFYSSSIYTYINF